MDIINATLINLYRVCPRECWLHANAIRMEQTSDLVADGKMIEEATYQQRGERYSQIELSAEYNGINLSGKIDFFDTKDKIIHETKRGNKVENAHIWQVKFYLWLLKLNDIDASHGIIEYPRLRETKKVVIDVEDVNYLENVAAQIKDLINGDTCPPVLNAKICKSCSYYDFCYSNEIDQ